MFDGPLGLVEYFGAIISWVFCGVWVLSPLRGASDASETRAYFMYVTGRRRTLDRNDGKSKRRFAIVDLLALAFVMPIPLIIIAYSGSSFGIEISILLVALPVIWCFGLSFLAKHQVHYWRRRFVFLAFVMPSGCLIGLLSFLAIWELVRRAYPFVKAENEMSTLGAAFVVSIVFLIMYITRRAAFWCISR